jgi:hypothetical protein
MERNELIEEDKQLKRRVIKSGFLSFLGVVVTLGSVSEAFILNSETSMLFVGAWGLGILFSGYEISEFKYYLTERRIFLNSGDKDQSTEPQTSQTLDNNIGQIQPE